MKEFFANKQGAREADIKTNVFIENLTGIEVFIATR